MGSRSCTRRHANRGGWGMDTHVAHMGSHNVIMSQLYCFVKLFLSAPRTNANILCILAETPRVTWRFYRNPQHAPRDGADDHAPAALQHALTDAHRQRLLRFGLELEHPELQLGGGGLRGGLVLRAEP